MVHVRAPRDSPHAHVEGEEGDSDHEEEPEVEALSHGGCRGRSGGGASSSSLQAAYLPYLPMHTLPAQGAWICLVGEGGSIREGRG